MAAAALFLPRFGHESGVVGIFVTRGATLLGEFWEIIFSSFFPIFCNDFYMAFIARYFSVFAVNAKLSLGVVLKSDASFPTRFRMAGGTILQTWLLKTMRVLVAGDAVLG